MDRTLFHKRLDELAEVWYIDAGKKSFGFEEKIRSGKTRALRFSTISTEELRCAIAASESNPTGYPVIERWKHAKNKSKTIRIKTK
jgi:hypothetical protein